MARGFCPECGAEIAEGYGAKACPRCGRSFEFFGQPSPDKGALAQVGALGHEDHGRIYEEEKARFAARERLKQEELARKERESEAAGAEALRKSWPWAVGCLVLAAVCGFGGLAQHLRAEREGEDATAWVAAQDFVTQRLRAPSPASFPSFSPEVVRKLGGGRYLVTSYVDSQNLFGGTVRTHFTCTVRFAGGGRYVCEDLRLE